MHRTLHCPVQNLTCCVKLQYWKDGVLSTLHAVASQAGFDIAWDCIVTSVRSWISRRNELPD